jgi:type II secretory pathway component PulF
MTYPMIVFGVIMLVIGFMLLTVVPQVKNLYKDLGKELPLLTQILVGMADFLIGYWWIVLIVIGVEKFQK